MELFQTTLAAPIKCYGVGVHSGMDVTVSILPAPENTGIVFKRTDLAGDNIIPATYDNVVDTRLCTVIANKAGARVSTIEHIMSALWSFVDNAVVEVNNEEMAIMDGSAAPFIALIEKAGVKTQSAPKKFIRIKKSVKVEDGDKSIELQPYDGFVVDYTINFAHHAIGEQSFKFREGMHSFNREISRARTFGFAHEIEQLKQMGLARGGSLNNAIGIDDEGVMNPEGLRYNDEFVKHKLLDCIGDLFLAGYRIQGQVVASKAGHAIHNRVLKELFKQEDAFEIFEMPTRLPQTAAL